MKNKALAMILLLAMTLMLAACGNTAAPAPAAQTQAPVESAAPQQAEQPEPAPAEETGWVPDQTVTFMVPNGAGGGTDLFARKIAEIAVEKGFCPVTIVIENKPGGSSTVGYSYLHSLKGSAQENYTLGATPPGFWTSPLSGIAEGYGVDDFAEVSLMAVDPLCLVVHKDSAFRSVDDVIAYAKDHPGELKCLGGGQLSDETILTYMFNDVCGVKLTYITMTDGSDVLSAALGNHADLYIMNPIEGREHFENGTLIPLAISTQERVESFSDIPTFVEQGYDVVHQQYRALVINNTVPEEVIKFYSDMCEQVAQTEEWQEYLTLGGLQPLYKNSEEFDEFNKTVVDNYMKYIAMVMADREG